LFSKLFFTPVGVPFKVDESSGLEDDADNYDLLWMLLYGLELTNEFVKHVIYNSIKKADNKSSAFY